MTQWKVALNQERTKNLDNQIYIWYRIIIWLFNDKQYLHTKNTQIMKKILTIAAIAMIGLLTFAGCSKKSSSGPSYYMKATLGSSAYNAGNCIASSNGAGGLTITGLGGSSTSPTPPYVSVEIVTWSNAAGTFNFDSTMTTNFAQYILSDTTSKISKSGSVIVNTVSSTVVTGTFTFTCTDGTVVSGGTFSAKVL